MANPISVTSPSSKVRIYTYEDGTSYTYSNGSPAWRNNNPGNLIYSSFSVNNGAIGKDPSGFAIFPNNETGIVALYNLVTKNYANYSIDSMMEKYAPNFENDTTAYQNFLTNKVGVLGNTSINRLTDTQLQSLLQGIIKFEGTLQGNVQGVPPESVNLSSVDLSSLTHSTSTQSSQNDTASSIQQSVITSITPQIPSSQIQSNTAIRVGDKGESVTQLQSKLQSLGYDVEVDGIFGNQTKQAVMEYQANHGLKIDGVVGKDTLRSFNTQEPRNQPFNDNNKSLDPNTGKESSYPNIDKSQLPKTLQELLKQKLTSDAYDILDNDSKAVLASYDKATKELNDNPIDTSKLERTADSGMIKSDTTTMDPRVREDDNSIREDDDSIREDDDSIREGDDSIHEDDNATVIPDSIRNLSPLFVIPDLNGNLSQSMDPRVREDDNSIREDDDGGAIYTAQEIFNLKHFNLATKKNRQIIYNITIKTNSINNQSFYERMVA